MAHPDYSYESNDGVDLSAASVQDIQTFVTEAVTALIAEEQTNSAIYRGLQSILTAIATIPES